MKHILTLETSDVVAALKNFFDKENVKYGKLEVQYITDGQFTVTTSGLTLGSSEPKKGEDTPNSVAEVAAETKKGVDIFGSAL